MECNARQLENGKCGLTGEECIGEARMYHEPGQTNGDRIRAMSDRELVEKIEDLLPKLMEAGDNSLAEAICDMHGECDKDGNCTRQRHQACILRWVKRPADKEIDNPSVSFADSSLCTREPLGAAEGGGGTDGGGTAV